MQDQNVIRELVTASHTELSGVDLELVEFEKHPNDMVLLASIFRSLHTVRGECGTLVPTTLEGEGPRELSLSLVSLVLQTVDVMRKAPAWNGAPRHDQLDLSL